MKIKLLVGRAGANFSNDPGEVVDLPSDEATRMVESGKAEPVVESKKKRATRGPSESR